MTISAPVRVETPHPNPKINYIVDREGAVLATVQDLAVANEIANCINRIAIEESMIERLAKFNRRFSDSLGFEPGEEDED
jgi:hypothetical protein